MPQPSTNASTISFGSYRLISVLGQGGMAVVYRAEKQGLAGFYREVALKVIKPQLTIGEQARQFEASFKNEARLGGALSHKNIVKTLDFGQTEGCYFIAMELVDGPSLRHLINWHGQVMRRPISVGIALQIALEILAGLGYAHSAKDKSGRQLGLVHRDLKPSNILLGAQGETKISDFGIARAESNLDQTQVAGMAKGTLKYMSPEQAWGSLELDRRSDLFAVGLMTYEMLTLRTLYHAQSQLSLLRMAQDAEVHPHLSTLPDIPLRDELTAFLAKAMAKDKEARFQDADEMALAVEGLLTRLRGVPRLDRWLTRTCPKMQVPSLAEPPEDAGTEVHSVLLQSLVSLGVSPPQAGTATLRPAGLGAPTRGEAHKEKTRTAHGLSLSPSDVGRRSTTVPVSRGRGAEEATAPAPPRRGLTRFVLPIGLGGAATAAAITALLLLKPCGPTDSPQPIAQLPAPTAPPQGEVLSNLNDAVVTPVNGPKPTSKPEAPPPQPDTIAQRPKPAPQSASNKPVAPQPAPPVIKPKPAAGPTAALSINSRPVEGVRVKMDGKIIGHIPLNTDIPTGKHILELVDAEGTTIQTKITVGTSESWRCGGRFSEGSLVCRRSN